MTVTLPLAHDFTLDELCAYHVGTLTPARAAVVAAHLDAGCLACRSWLVNAGEIERLLRSGALPDRGRPGRTPGATRRARGRGARCAPAGSWCYSTRSPSKGCWWWRCCVGIGGGACGWARPCPSSG